MDIPIFLLLVSGHYLADFGLQSSHVADSKQYVFIKAMGFHALTAHASMHALIAGLLSQSVPLALCIGITHWIIDFCKASRLFDDKFPHTSGARKDGQEYGLYGINVDQSLHILVIFISVYLIF